MQPSPDSPAPLNVTVPFDSELGLQFTELGPDGARAQLDVRPKLLQLTGVVHGGTAEPLHRGRRQQLWLVTITDDTDRVVARGQVRLQNLEARP